MTTAVYHVQRQKICIAAAGLAWTAVVITILFLNPVLALAALGASIVLAVFLWKPFFALLLVAATFPFIQLEIQVGGLNAPFVDLIALLGFVAWVIRSMVCVSADTRYFKRMEWPFIFLFIAWIAVAVLSSLTSVDVFHSLYATLRPIAFFYFVFVLFPVNAIRSRKELRWLATTMIVVATAIALSGFYGFVSIPVERFIDHRVVPVAIFGVNILGGNQNSIANVMVIALPLAMFFLKTEKNARVQKFIFLTLLIQLTALLLTFSRTAWLALLLQLGCYAAVHYRSRIVRHLRLVLVAALLVAPLLGYMIFFSVQDAVRSSNENRGILLDVAYGMFQERPVLGQGPGTFLSFVGRNTIYTQEFGDPLDAHGFIQKVGSELGVAGLIVYISMVIVVLRQLYSAYRRDQQSAWGQLLFALLLSVIGTIFFQLFQTAYYIGVMWFPIGLALAARRLAYQDQQQAI